MDAGAGGELHLVREALGLRPAIVVAHPDDETLWCGGLPLRFPEKEWTAIACSVPRFDSIRAHYFFDACSVLGATARILPYTEADPSMELDHLGELDLSGFSAIVTHGADGEYGHTHHRQLHRFIRRVWSGCPTVAIGFLRGQHQFDLTREQAARKLDALKCYRGPSAGSNLPKWAHLLERYCRDGFTLERETYDLL